MLQLAPVFTQNLAFFFIISSLVHLSFSICTYLNASSYIDSSNKHVFITFFFCFYLATCPEQLYKIFFFFQTSCMIDDSMGTFLAHAYTHTCHSQFSSQWTLLLYVFF